jgi:hypothetical protein
MVQTRMVEQVLIHKLVMNPMRGNTENSVLVAWSDDKEKIVDFYNHEKVERYTNDGSPSFPVHGDSHNWQKEFRLGGCLEWYNPIDSFDQLNHYGQGIQQEWVDLDFLPNITVGVRV